MDGDLKALGALVTRAREERHFSKRAAADACGVSETLIRRIEAAEWSPAPGLMNPYRPSPGKLRKVCAGLGIDPEEAFELAGLEYRDDLAMERPSIDDLEDALRRISTSLRDAQSALIRLRGEQRGS